MKLSDPEVSYIRVGCVFMTAMWENTYQNVKLSDPEVSYIGVGCLCMTAMWENTYQNVKLSDPKVSYIGVGCACMTVMWENTYQDPAMPTTTYPDPPSTSHKYLWHHILIQIYGCSITTILPVLIKITT